MFPAARKNGHAGLLGGVVRSAPVGIFRKIIGVLIDAQQSLAKSAFGKDHIMDVELYMKEFKLVEFLFRIKRNRRPIDEAPDRHEHAVEVDCMPWRQEQIRVRRFEGER